MAEQQLQLVIKREDGLPEIIDLYNRINSSGVVVRDEERAYATMVRFHPGAGAWLQETFAAIHGEPEDRNTVLQRQRESRFGFRLFVRTFAQVVAHHLGSTRTDLSRLRTWLWDPRWSQEGRGQRLKQEVLEQTAAVLVRTARVLGDPALLGCDDLRFLPSAEGLRPVFALLLKYPSIDDPLLARAILSLQLDGSVVQGRIDDRKVLEGIERSDTLHQALEFLPSLGSRQDLRDSIDRADSMQSRWVSLLYWLGRASGARDYGHEQPGEVPRTLDARAEAHKEHIVPFSLLHPLYEGLEAKGGHGRSHPANGLGNLTLLSEGFNMGHGAAPIPLWEVDPALLRPHCLDDPDVLTAYRTAVSLGLSDKTRLRAFQAFARGRREAIAGAMESWIRKVLSAEPTDPTSRPAPRKLAPSRADRLREQSRVERWPRAFEDALLALTRDAGSQNRWWVLYRQGFKNERQRISNQVQLAKDFRAVRIGTGVDEIERAREALSTHLTGRDDGYCWFYALDPLEATSANALRALADTRPWGEG